jgi:hypothetical protein
MPRWTLLLPLLSVLVPVAAVADSSGVAELTLGNVRTELKRSAVRIGAKYAKELSGTTRQLDSERSLFYFTPEIELRTGDEDAFRGIVAKVGGAFLKFKEVEVEGLPAVNTSKALLAFPVAAGLETDGEFRNLAGLAEVGLVPWMQGVLPGPFKSFQIGWFVQGGYKAELADSSASTGGASDQSKEKGDAELLRLKARAKWSPVVRFKSSALHSVGFVGTGDYWRDTVNGADYYRLEAKLQVHVSDKRSFDFRYERGAGPPTFNKGEQFSANLAIAF